MAGGVLCEFAGGVRGARLFRVSGLPSQNAKGVNMTAKLDHFQRAASDIGAHGDNDTLPFDVDNRFIADCKQDLAQIAFRFFESLSKDSEENSANKISELSIFSERLLVPAGPAGFRTTTKIQPFWGIYLNGLGVAIAERLEPLRSERACSYRYLANGDEELFDKKASWRAFRELSLADAQAAGDESVVVQCDISSFYEHISHHHVQNFIDDLFDEDKRIGNQVNALLSKFSAGRSFGLPVGGQCSRVLAELFLNQVDHELSNAGLKWRRYVDDYVLIADSKSTAYGALSVLSHTLADYGISLNKNKTMFLTAKHFSDYVATQLGGDDEEAGKLREIDLRFDPYSDTAADDYEALRSTVESLQVHKLLNRELEKALPDSFLITQIGRTLRLHEPFEAINLARTLVSPGNLHAFRASWSTIMRGLANLRANSDFQEIFGQLDALLDEIPGHSMHLIRAEGSVLHYLHCLRFAKTEARAAFVRKTYDSTLSETVRRACIDCWRRWKDRPVFTHLRNRWSQLNPESQRLLWLAAASFGDQGDGFRRQVRPTLSNYWRLGIERQNSLEYATTYRKWCDASASDV